MIKIDMTEVKKLEKDLSIVAARAVPYATRNTVNVAAFDTRKTSQRTIRREMTLRNKYTERTVRVNPARTLSIRHQAAAVGSTAGYMETQEFGGTKRKKGKEGTPIPTSYAAGQGRSKRPRTRLVRKPNRLASIRLTKARRRPKGTRQAILFKVQDAVTSGKRHVFIDFGGRKKKGIYRVYGGRKNFKRGWPTGARLELMHDLSKPSVRIPRSPWLHPSAIKNARRLPEIHAQSLQFQFKRLGLMKTR